MLEQREEDLEIGKKDKEFSKENKEIRAKTSSTSKMWQKLKK